MEFVELNNGVKMPILGYGVFQIADQEECERCVLDAIEAGYRLIDTAQAYGNEEAVGKAIKKCGIPREELFITTKVWISNAGYEKARKSIEESLEKLQLDYLDLLLIHQPFGDYYGTYRAMEELYKEGKLKAIGVSNFYPDRLIDLIKFNEVVPAVNQVETHVFNQQANSHEIMKKYGVQIESWGPFAEGKNNLFTDETLKAVGDKYNKSNAQVALRYLIQRGVVVIPKSVHKERMIQNIDVFDFELTKEDMDLIATLDKEESLFFSHYDPQTVEYLTSLVR
ncbi:2,5-diketo-D-gluconic acid reductase [Clostridium zeae]|uniref:2,5-diketo-D-gluconic acid reductase n=1 Tax=Clostridium zeae TaxID=2759022 RepID=A0ABQ1E8R8_9CLOT|nr:aldo/keto reductase [Clostridium zeae]GFZ31094.1 2,5-diketo-D-gluconic acid reductase [Clostridium zeae]